MTKYAKLDELQKYLDVKPKLGHYNDFVEDLDYEKNLAIRFGINSEACGAKRVVMGRTVIPPHKCNERHVHLNAEAAMYIVDGPMVLLLGPDAEKHVCPTGTFIFAPEGVIHGVANPRKDKECVLIFTYGGVPNKEAANFVAIDDSENDYPPAGWDEIDE